MKRASILFLSTALLLTLGACGSSEQTSSAAKSNSGQTSESVSVSESESKESQSTGESKSQSESQSTSQSESTSETTSESTSSYSSTGTTSEESSSTTESSSSSSSKEEIDYTPLHMVNEANKEYTIKATFHGGFSGRLKSSFFDDGTTVLTVVTNDVTESINQVVSAKITTSSLDGTIFAKSLEILEYFPDEALTNSYETMPLAYYTGDFTPAYVQGRIYHKNYSGYYFVDVDGYECRASFNDEDIFPDANEKIYMNAYGYKGYQEYCFVGYEKADVVSDLYFNTSEETFNVLAPTCSRRLDYNFTSDFSEFDPILTIDDEEMISAEVLESSRQISIYGLKKGKTRITFQVEDEIASIEVEVGHDYIQSIDFALTKQYYELNEQVFANVTILPSTAPQGYRLECSNDCFTLVNNMWVATKKGDCVFRLVTEFEDAGGELADYIKPDTISVTVQ